MARKGPAAKRWYGDKAGADKRQAAVPARPVVGLAANPKGVRFRCGDCEWIGAGNDAGKCQNPLPALHGRAVGADWCCDYYRHPGMRVIIK